MRALIPCIAATVFKRLVALFAGPVLSPNVPNTTPGERAFTIRPATPCPHKYGLYPWKSTSRLVDPKVAQSQKNDGLLAFQVVTQPVANRNRLQETTRDRSSNSNFGPHANNSSMCYCSYHRNLALYIGDSRGPYLEAVRNGLR